MARTVERNLSRHRHLRTIPRLKADNKPLTQSRQTHRDRVPSAVEPTRHDSLQDHEKLCQNNPELFPYVH